MLDDLFAALKLAHSKKAILEYCRIGNSVHIEFCAETTMQQKRNLQAFLANKYGIHTILTPDEKTLIIAIST